MHKAECKLILRLDEVRIYDRGPEYGDRQYSFYPPAKNPYTFNSAPHVYHDGAWWVPLYRINSVGHKKQIQSYGQRLKDEAILINGAKHILLGKRVGLETVPKTLQNSIKKAWPMYCK